MTSGCRRSLVAQKFPGIDDNLETKTPCNTWIFNLVNTKYRLGSKYENLIFWALWRFLAYLSWKLKQHGHEKDNNKLTRTNLFLKTRFRIAEG